MLLPDTHASPEEFTSSAVAQCTSAEVTAALVHCFQGYLVQMRFTPQTYEARFRAENLDPFSSRVYFSNGTPAAVVMIARRGWTSRLAAMAIAPDFGGRGLGKREYGQRHKKQPFERIMPCYSRKLRKIDLRYRFIPTTSTTI
jgi:hypothetical protein